MGFYEDWDRLDAEEARYEASLPVCGECGETIHDDYYYNITGVPVCLDCLESNYRCCTEDYIGGEEYV